MIRVFGSPERALDALREVVAAREAARPVTLVIRGCDSRASLALRAVPHILNGISDYDERRAAFDALAAETLVIDGRPMQQLSALDPRAVRTLRDAARCADRLSLASWTQWERIAPLLDLRAEKAVVESNIVDCPAVNIARGDAVVVYAPGESAAMVAFAVFALQELHAPVIVVGDTALCSGMRFVSETAESALVRARVVVAPAIDDPAVARGIARLDAALVAPFTSGIDTYVHGVARYDPWNRLSLLGAVQLALGAAPPRALTIPASEMLANTSGSVDGDLVTIAIRTFNRRTLFARALQSVAAQTYRSIEIVVVNDGDEDVADIVSSVPNARLVGNDVRLGAIPSLNVALRSGRGRWFGWLDDDDRYFPDHVARLVEVLQRSGLCAAHADTLSEYFDRAPDGTYARYGFAVNLDGDVDRDTIHVMDGVGPMALLVERQMLLELGAFDESLGHAEDWELLIRLARGHDLAHLRAVTAAYAIRNDATNMMQYGGDAMMGAMRRMVALDDLRDRPLLAAARRELIANMEKSGGRAVFPEPPLRFSE